MHMLRYPTAIIVALTALKAEAAGLYDAPIPNVPAGIEDPIRRLIARLAENLGRGK